MNSRQNNRLQAALVASLLVAGSALSSLAAQTPAQPGTALAPAVPLDLGACAAVPALGTVSLDWNPAFDNASAVAGVDRLSLILTNVAADQVTPVRPGGPGIYTVRSTSVSPLANGYYHIEFQLPRLQPGSYRVVDAAVAPRLASGYEGVTPQMTFSPARNRYCITVASSGASSSRTTPAS